jgi:hypothetical protein
MKYPFKTASFIVGLTVVDVYKSMIKLDVF